VKQHPKRQRRVPWHRSLPLEHPCRSHPAKSDGNTRTTRSPAARITASGCRAWCYGGGAARLWRCPTRAHR